MKFSIIKKNTYKFCTDCDKCVIKRKSGKWIIKKSVCNVLKNKANKIARRWKYEE